MELTRRDALAVLVGAGIVGGATTATLARDGFAAEQGGDAGRDRPDEVTGDAESIIAALVGTAEVVYPSAVENVPAFVESYGATKLDARPGYRQGAIETLPVLDGESTISFDRRYAELDADDREVVLQRVGAETADPDPDGTGAERVRYYFVNEVLYALYASPTGGALVGIENPQGHPGGTDSYQRGPPG